MQLDLKWLKSSLVLKTDEMALPVPRVSGDYRAIGAHRVILGRAANVGSPDLTATKVLQAWTAKMAERAERVYRAKKANRAREARPARPVATAPLESVESLENAGYLDRMARPVSAGRQARRVTKASEG